MTTAHAAKNASRTPAEIAALTLGALGVVYGDIGTSPLYALKEVFHSEHVPVTADNILGVLSLIFWTMTVIVSVKYVLLVLRADNNGEGGLIAMLALATSAVKDRPALRAVLMSVGLFGTAIFYGDGVITPAISAGVLLAFLAAWAVVTGRRAGFLGAGALAVRSAADCAPAPRSAMRLRVSVARARQS